MKSRALATEILSRVCSDAVSLDRALDEGLPGTLGTRERSFIRDLCFGVMRWYPQLDFFLDTLLNKPIRKKDFKLRILCWLGLYQVIHQRTADHAAVSATVEACNELALPWARGMVNAILRTFIRQRQTLLARLDANEVSGHAHPQWLADAIRHDWPDEWLSVLTANNRQAPMSLRVNTRKNNRDDYRQHLDEHDLASHPIEFCDQGLNLETPCEVLELPGFDTGHVSVQDGAAQLATPLLDLGPGLRVLDACAAPGGKTCHMLEAEPRLRELVAIDIQPARLEKIENSLSRLGLRASTIAVDVSETGAWWDGRKFDRILLDAPCSATGVIRRHADIKALRSDRDITRVIEQQWKLLRSVWPLLAVGGKLVYATCSILKRENDGVVGRLIREQPGARIEHIESGWGYETGAGRQILPGQHDFDGFYYACLYKQSENG